MRLALPNATIHMHQPLGGAQGQASDIVIQAEEIVRLKKRIIDIFVNHTGKTPEEVERVTDRDVYMTAQEATDFGLIDSVLIGEEREEWKELEVSFSPIKHRCNFCTRSHEEVERLIAGPEHIHICNFCVDLCHSLLQKEEAQETRLDGKLEFELTLLATPDHAARLTNMSSASEMPSAC